MKVAAIDIGSNAVRMSICQVIPNGKEYILKRLEYIRFPLRLGKEVFGVGSISEETAQRLAKLLRCYNEFQSLYDTEATVFCATSAFRDAENGTWLKEYIRQEAGVYVWVIDGQEEAQMISYAIRPYISHRQETLHVDVGGGSTELNFYSEGELVASQSFQVGHVRYFTKQVTVWDEIDSWVEANIRPVLSSSMPFRALATGGNIGKLISLYSSRIEKANKLNSEQLSEILEEIKALSFEERISELGLNADRADIIVPAGEIYLHIMQSANVHHIESPEVGLTDGLILYLLEKKGIDLSTVRRQNS